MLTLREQIAKDLYADILAQSDIGANEAASTAVSYADILIAELDSTAPKQFKLKGCTACFGSGGKKATPCRKCNGTGKITI